MLLDFAETFYESPLVFPVLECLHILGFAFSIGTIALVDLRLLGIGVNREPATELSTELAPWTLFGIAGMLISGALLYLSDPDMYYTNWVFLAKITVLMIAIVFHYTTHRKVIQSGAPGKLVASISLALWVSVIFGGIFIAFV